MQLEDMERGDLYDLLSDAEHSLRSFPLDGKLDVMIGLLEQMQLVDQSSVDLETIRELLDKAESLLHG